MDYSNFLAVAGGLLALGLIFAVYFGAHHYLVSRLYSAFVGAHWSSHGGASTAGARFVTAEERAQLKDAVKDGLRAGDELHFEANVWCVILLLFIVLLVGVQTLLAKAMGGR